MTLLTPKQVAARAGVSDSLVYEWVQQGLIPHFRLGGKGKRGHIRIDEAELDAYLASCRREARLDASAPPLRHIKLA